MIRDGKAGDLPDMAGILAAWVAAMAWMPKLHSPAEDLWFVGELVRLSTVRVAAGKAAGEPRCAVLGFLSRQGAEVDALYLTPQARRQGLGRALIADAMATEPVLRLWTFQANATARAFYAALGFVEIGRTDDDNDEGLPDVRLEWRRDV